MSPKPPNRILLDCDTGIDDALAILYLAAQSGVEIVAAGSVHGNVAAPLGALNTLRVLELAGLAKVPVALGAERPLAQPLATSEHVHGEDGLGNVGLPPPAGMPSTEPAAVQIVRLARANPGELILLATAPLTNLALALLLEPALPRLLRRVVVMGGAVYSRGNVTQDAEANIWHDPEAADLVLSAGWPLTLVPLDVTSQVRLDERDVQALGAPGHPVGLFASSILRHYLGFYESFYGPRECHLHDPLAAAIAIDPDLAGYRETAVRVELRGTISRGATRGAHLGLPGPEGPPIAVATSVDGDRFKQEFLAALSGQPQPR